MGGNEGNAVSTGNGRPRDVLRVATKVYARVVAQLEERRHIPVATYRLQFNRFFTFRDAHKMSEYLSRLGVTDVYASPYFKARPDSLHGYDITDHNQLNPAIGNEDEYNAFVDGLHRHGLGQILDIVPNHMGIGEGGNARWTDVLENGRSSLNAPFFDIDWEPFNPKLTYKVLLPVLGDQYGCALENGELQVAFIPGEGRFVLRYWENAFPINPRSYVDILDLDKERLIEELGPENEATREYQSIITAAGHLPEHWETDPEKALEGNREKEVIKRRLAALCAREPAVVESIERGLAILNGEKGKPRSYDLLDALLEHQPYRLSFWRVATEEINYRRFFDVNDLAAIQVDRPAVFEETHRMILKLLRERKLDGLRVDHVDGLRDPAGYLQAVQRAYFLDMCRDAMQEADLKAVEEELPEIEHALLERFEKERASKGGGLLYKPLYMLVEKILGSGEDLPAEWPVYGTTGYEYTNAVNGLFVDRANKRAMDDIYSAFIDNDIEFQDLVYNSKQEIMHLSLASEVNTLTGMLTRISGSDRRYRDFTVSGLRNAIREVIACFRVYRTYITPDHTKPDDRDRGIIETAITGAKRRNPATDPSVFDFLRNMLLLRGNEGLPKEAVEARWDFVLKFQQVTGPVTAKALEDTAFYIYNRLVSLNEVGGEPDKFGASPAQFHEGQAKRLREWPHSLLTTSTHDTKRSEDVRARINVLSEMPREWRTAVRRWARYNRKHKRRVDGQPAPDANEEYLLYQTLLGVWPLGAEIDAEEYGDLVDRVQAYMTKALNEAKVHTSWVNTNEGYLEAVSNFVASILRRGDDNRFLEDFIPLQRRIARYGAFNSLSQLLLKITSPGVPDIYQGTELWDFSLVDPDNRRPVDYGLRRRLLAQSDRVRNATGVARLLDSLEDGRIKLFVTSRSLRFRREHRDLFERGEYTPIGSEGKQAECVVAFARHTEGKSVLVAVTRLVTRLSAGVVDIEAPVDKVWGDARMILPEGLRVGSGTRFRNVFTGDIIEISGSDGNYKLVLSEVFSTLPVALLESVENSTHRKV